MKILSITAQKPHSTGSGTYLTEIVNALASEGNTQSVVAGVYRDDTVKFPEQVKFYPVYFDEDFPIVGMSDVMPYPSQLYSKMTDEDIATFEKMFRPVIEQAVNELKPDIIFCHHLFLLTAIVRRMYPNIKVYGISHGSDLRQFKQSHNISSSIKADIASLDKIFALHEEQKEQIVELFGVPVDKVFIAGSGYNSHIFNIIKRNNNKSTCNSRENPNVLKIAYAGKLSRAKGLIEFMKAAELLLNDNDFPEFNIILAGGCQDEEIRLTVQKPFAEYVGMLNQYELSDLLQQSDIFVLPSYYEGLPLVLIEAMACGAIPVCTDLPGVKQWIESSIQDSNVIFVQMPEMATIDEPTEDAKPIFTQNLANAIKQAYKKSQLQKEGNIAQPNTTAVSWQACARNIFT